MNQCNVSTTAVGVGSYGTVLTTALIGDSHEVVLWSHDSEHIATPERGRCNAAFLPNVPLPDTLHLEDDLATALVASCNILVVVSSHVFSEVLRQIKPLMRPDTRLVWATKGLEAKTGRLLQDVTCEALGDQTLLVITSSPAFAEELAAGLPTAISLASTNQTFIDDLQQLLYYGKSFRIYSNPDFIGMQLGGVVKNVIVIGTGMSGGIGFGADARTALITRGLAEMSYLGAALGVDPVTFMGIAGSGDLVLVYTDNQSRNHRFDMMLGRGMDIQSARKRTGQAVEGYRDTREARELVHRFGAKVPTTKKIYQVLYCGKDAREAALVLLSRTHRDKRSGH